MDGVAKHRTERGSAGSNTTTRQKTAFDPALPRSVLCLLNTVHTGHQLNNTQLPTTRKQPDLASRNQSGGFPPSFTSTPRPSMTRTPKGEVMKALLLLALTITLTTS